MIFSSYFIYRFCSTVLFLHYLIKVLVKIAGDLRATKSVRLNLANEHVNVIEKYIRSTRSEKEAGIACSPFMERKKEHTLRYC